ncbi:MAG: efflux RND transporter permease subunit [Oligoflexales bacterium]|nr:efflux RND transporter permease subunit [Oligoflexales bacterium]
MVLKTGSTIYLASSIAKLTLLFPMFVNKHVGRVEKFSQSPRKQMKLVGFCLRNALLLNLLAIGVSIAGIFTAMNINREAFPNVDFDIVTISTDYPGASSSEVEFSITTPIEREIESIGEVEEHYSFSVESLSLIVLKIKPELSEQAKNGVINNIQRSVDRIPDLPKDLPSAPAIKEVDSGELPVIELALSGNMEEAKLQEFADELANKIKRLPDAKAPLKYGLRDKEYWVEIDPKKLKKFHIGMPEIIESLTDRNLNFPGGVFSSGEGDLLVRTIGKIQTKDEIDELVIRTNSSGAEIRIRDVGSTTAAFADSNLRFKTNGMPSINLIIRKSSSGDIIHLVKDIRNLVKEYQSLPGREQLKVAFVNDTSLFVKNRLGVLLDNGIMGIALVVICLLLFLSKGIALVAALGMPVALLGAIATMNLLGLSINLLTLFALVIVLGMLVDDAIIVAENIWRHYEEGKSPWDATIAGTKEVMLPVTTTILTTVSAFSPLLMVDGIFGKFIAPLPKVVIIALVISLIEALFILPSHAYDALRISSKGLKNRRNTETSLQRFIKSLSQRYTELLNKTLRWRYPFVISLVIVLLACYWVKQNRMRTILFPNDGIEYFFIRGELDPGSSLRNTAEKMSVFEAMVAEHVPANELLNFVTYIGLQQGDPVDPFKSQASHIGQIGVYLSPQNSRDRSADMIVNSLRGKADQLAQTHGFKKLQFVRQKLGPPIGKPVAVRIQGHNFDQMQEASSKIMTLLSKTKGVEDISSDFLSGKKELQVHIDERKANRAFLSTKDVALHLRTLLAGQVASYIQENDKKIPIRVRFNTESRANLKPIYESLILNRHGMLVPMNSLAEFEKEISLSNIRHRNGSRIITVTANIDEQVTTSSEIGSYLNHALDEIIDEYQALSIEPGGEYEDTTKSLESLTRSFIIALIVIFLILASQFRSLSLPFVIMAAIPFGLIGVLVAFYLHGLPFSFLAMIGIIGLSGVVVNDSIVLVDFINKGIDAGLSPYDATIKGGRLRFRAVWLTSVTTIFGLLPLAYGIGGEDAFLKPAAMALGYGLVFSTVLILLFIPALYMIRVDLIQAIRKLWSFFNVDSLAESRESKGSA